MAKFEVVEILEDGTVASVAGLMPFTDGKTAKFYAQQLTMQRGGKFQPRPIADEAGSHSQDWLVPIPFWPMIQQSIDSRFTYRRRMYIDPMYDPRQKVVRYFSSEEHKGLSKSVAKELGSFVRDFFLHDREYDYWITMVEPTWYDNFQLGIAETEEDIVSVYYRGLDSCMSKPPQYYVEEYEPVRCYASGDFAIAFVQDETGRLKARAVVCPERKIYARRYGNAQALEHHLHKLGYREGFGDDWLGLRLKTKRLSGEYVDGEDENDPEDYEWESACGWAAPYIDFWSECVLDEENEEWITSGAATHDLTNTNGIADEEAGELEICHCCHKPGNLNYIHGAKPDQEYQCYDCRKKNIGLTGWHNNPPISICIHYDRNKPRWVKMSNGKLADVTDIGMYRQDTVTNEWVCIRELPHIMGEQLTKNEAKERYSEYWDILGNAYLPQTPQVEDGRRVHQEVHSAA